MNVPHDNAVASHPCVLPVVARYRMPIIHARNSNDAHTENVGIQWNPLNTCQHIEKWSTVKQSKREPLRVCRSDQKKPCFLRDWFLLQAQGRTDGFCTLVTAEERRVISAYINTGKFGSESAGVRFNSSLLKSLFTLWVGEAYKRPFGKNINSWHMESKL